MQVQNRPGVIHYPIVRFEGETREICEAYNMAIVTILRTHAGAMPFHQFGTSHKGENEPGSHGWEAWFTQKNADEIVELFPEIKRMAGEILARSENE